MKFLKIMLIVILAGVMGKTTYASNESKQLIDGFTNESKLGIVITTGNSKTLTFDAAQKDTYEWGHNKLGFLGTYLRSTSKGIESARRWSLGLRYDRAIAERWALFVSQMVEGDSYAGFLQRYNTDIGGKYNIVKTDANQWFAEAGYRFQHENQITGNEKNSSYSRLYTEYEHRWNVTVSSKLWLEYLQNLSDGEDRFFNGEVSTKAALTNILSVQFAYLVKYRNKLPASVPYKTDTMLTAALLAQF